MTVQTAGLRFGGILAAAALAYAGVADAQPREAGNLVFEAAHGATFRFGGVLGERVRANTENWLLPAPAANPGIIEMFRKRDRRPVPNLVPWAGEFAGKYLISALQACRMSDDARLHPHVASFVHELISTQADDGYMGPFPRDQRLLANWDLWGHYHIMLGLLMWYEDTGDANAFECARRIGDLVCDTYLDSGRRVFDAGSHEMNMAIIHSLGRLYRHTGEERYLAMMREIEADWERAGDYFRTGLAGLEFYRTPRPRWESLHDLQGLLELYRITGDDAYKRAFISHWETIAAYDRHPSGGFTTDEQAIGNPYTPGAIETCCTTAWMALSTDMLHLTGDPRAADELELSTWNSMLGSQHPSGRWWTYNTPMDGYREASAHNIAWQARYGTPELNCCSANAPRGLGVLSEWAVVPDDDGLAVNYYGPFEASLVLRDGTRLRLTQETRYPADGEVSIRVGLERPAAFDLRLRVPAWSSATSAALNGEPLSGLEPGRYLTLRREWHDGDTVTLALDLTVRYMPGALARTGRAVIWRGPVLLAFDAKWNEMDATDPPTLDLESLDLRPVEAEGKFMPIVLLETHAADGRMVRLCDFATAGANGTEYVSWLPVVHSRPPAVQIRRPRSGQAVPPGPMLFEWMSAGEATYTWTLARDPKLSDVVLERSGLESTRLRLDFAEQGAYYWAVAAVNDLGQTLNLGGPRALLVSDQAAPLSAEYFRQIETGLIAASTLDGTANPTAGELVRETGTRPAADRHGRPDGALAFDGDGSMALYRVYSFPEDAYTFAAWVLPGPMESDRLHQVFSAWTRPMDDPLRVGFQGGKLYARIEAGGAWGVAPVPVASGQWVHVAAVKDAGTLTLYVNGAPASRCTVPTLITSAAEDFALGGNPHYTGSNECFAGCVDDFVFLGRALSAEEVVAHCEGRWQPEG